MYHLSTSMEYLVQFLQMSSDRRLQAEFDAQEVLRKSLCVELDLTTDDLMGELLCAD
jgi:hypothetical protein